MNINDFEVDVNAIASRLFEIFKAAIGHNEYEIEKKSLTALELLLSLYSKTSEADNSPEFGKKCIGFTFEILKNTKSKDVIDLVFKSMQRFAKSLMITELEPIKEFLVDENQYKMLNSIELLNWKLNDDSQHCNTNDQLRNGWIQFFKKRMPIIIQYAWSGKEVDSTVSQKFEDFMEIFESHFKNYVA